MKPAVGSAASMVRPGKPVPPAAPTPRKPLPSFSDAEELNLASSSLMPVADEVKPPPPPLTARKSSAELGPIPPRPPSSAEIVTSASPLPATSRVPSPSPRDAETPLAPAVIESSPQVGGAGTVELSDAAVEQLAAIVQTVFDSTIAPLRTKQGELEARLQLLLQKAPAPMRQPSISGLAPVRSMAPSVDITGSFNSNVPGARPSLISTSYGLVSVMPGPAPRPAIDEALERVGPIDVPDFAGKRKFAGAIVIGILILAVVGAILATILSYS